MSTLIIGHPPFHRPRRASAAAELLAIDARPTASGTSISAMSRSGAPAGRRSAPARRGRASRGRSRRGGLRRTAISLRFSARISCEEPHQPLRAREATALHRSSSGEGLARCESARSTSAAAAFGSAHERPRRAAAALSRSALAPGAARRGGSLDELRALAGRIPPASASTPMP